MTTTSLSAGAWTTHVVVSQDGATIRYLTLGSGPSVMVIPGALAVAADYTAFGRALAERFTVQIIERRGRGQSSPQGAEYSIRIECEDVLAVQRLTGASALVGHSYGGLVALEVARDNPSLSRIAQRVAQQLEHAAQPCAHRAGSDLQRHMMQWHVRKPQIDPSAGI
jgi:pimeloyl-ACP methyl ester carboxylesterase